MISENRKVVLFLYNPTVHPETLVAKYSNKKVDFLHKDTTSRLQPLDAGIIQSFMVKYRKQLMRYVLARFVSGFYASVTAKAVDIHRAIKWVAAAWNEVS